MRKLFHKPASNWAAHKSRATFSVKCQTQTYTLVYQRDGNFIAWWERFNDQIENEQTAVSIFPTFSDIRVCVCVWYAKNFCDWYVFVEFVHTAYAIRLIEDQLSELVDCL